MKRRILQVVIVCRNEERQRYQSHRQHDREGPAARIGECRIAHQTRRVDHRQLVNELHWVFQRCMEKETPRAHEQVADEGDDEDGIMVVREAGSNAPVAAVYEK